MESLFEGYKKASAPVPETMLAWQLFGTGLENLGRFARPCRVPTPQFGPDELLARVDAAGLCFSDIKILNLGSQHPRIQGRDLETDPVIMGHEVAITLVGVGERLTSQYRVGQRFVVQADIYYKGVGLAFGYQLPGALCQYARLGEEILNGDDGCYLIPIADSTGYAEAALSEPWACVECAYRMRHRVGLSEGAVALVIANGGTLEYELGPEILAGGKPSKIVAAGVSAGFLSKLKEAAQCFGCDVVEAAATVDVDALSAAHTGGQGFGDIIVLGSDSADLVESASRCLGKGGVLLLAANQPLGRKTQVDVGRIHYEATQYIGTTEACLSTAYGKTRGSELAGGGATWIVGAAGPMGQMHVQRALELRTPPRRVVATDVDPVRLGTVEDRYGDLARERGIELLCLNPVEMGQDAFAARLRELEPEGFDDVIVMAPVAALVESSAPWLKRGGVMNVFAGLPRGTMAGLDLSAIYLSDNRVIGTSGSAISDLEFTLGKTESGELSPNRSVAAVGGIEAAWEGLRGVKTGRFAGKVVIFPQLERMPLIPLQTMEASVPAAAAALTPKGEWTRDAEKAFMVTGLQPSRTGCQRLGGRVALVTGGAQGLGRALAERLAGLAVRTVITDINAEGVQRAAAEIAESTGVPVIGEAADVTSAEGMARAVARAVDEWGRLDILVCNAGILFAGGLTDIEIDRWRKVIDVNLVGYFVCAREAAKVMVPQQSGVIIQINSKSGKKGSFRNSAYAASKFGGIGLTQSLALELAPEGIRVNSICPGNLLDSPLWVDSLYGQYAERWGITVEEVRAKYEQQVPLGRGCEYADVANMVEFLASDDSNYMTGQAINVTGGQQMD